MTNTSCPNGVWNHTDGCTCIPNGSVTAESDVDLTDTAFDADGAYTGDYDSPEECRAAGAHSTNVDEDGYCNLCGDGPDDEDDESAAGYKVIAPEPPFSQVANNEHRERSAEYAARYTGTTPESFDVEIDWSKENQVQKSARDLVPGDRLLGDGVVTSAVMRNGTVWVHTGGTDPKDKADHWFNHGDPIIVHKARVDLSDPDQFEVEVRREIAERISYAEDMTNDESYVMPEEERAAMALAIRTRMARATQPGNISPIVNMNVDAVDGRAKVGDNVIFSSPMHGDSSYEVLGKMAAVDIQGHDGTQVVWGETGGVEYILKDLRTGKQTTSDLRQHMWRRIPAPGDMGVSAQVIAQSRYQPNGV
jgi:hypothetical protein